MNLPGFIWESCLKRYTIRKVTLRDFLKACAGPPLEVGGAFSVARPSPASSEVRPRNPKLPGKLPSRRSKTASEAKTSKHNIISVSGPPQHTRTFDCVHNVISVSDPPQHTRNFNCISVSIPILQCALSPDRSFKNLA